jgi:hypothetical protein
MRWRDENGDLCRSVSWSELVAPVAVVVIGLIVWGSLVVWALEKAGILQ